VSPFKLSRTHTHEGNTIPVLGVHVCMDLEYESCKLCFFRANDSNRRLARLRTWSDPDKRVEQLLYAKVIHGTPEKYRRNRSLQVLIHIKFRVDRFDQLHIRTKLPRMGIADISLQHFIVDIGHFNTFLDRLLAGRKQVKAFPVKTVYAFECLSHTDWPAKGANLNGEFLFDLVKE